MLGVRFCSWFWILFKNLFFFLTCVSSLGLNNFLICIHTGPNTPFLAFIFMLSVFKLLSLPARMSLNQRCLHYWHSVPNFLSYVSL